MARKLVMLGLCSSLVALLFFLDLATGSLMIDFRTVWEALTGNRSTDHHQVVAVIRMPRAAVALVVGAGLAAAGVCMQALIRNPLASPELFGVSHGAALAIVIGFLAVPQSPVWVYQFFALAGAMLAGLFIFVLGSAGALALSPFKVIAAGSAVSLFLGSLTQGVLVLNERSIDELRFWLAGSVAGRSIEQFVSGLPLIAVGLAASIALGRGMNLLQLSEETALGIGARTAWIRRMVFAAGVLLASGCVAIAGPVAFIGLAVPHLARAIVGSDYRWVTAYAIVLGAGLLMLADIIGKIVIHPAELSAGIVTVLMGAPFFVYLARRKELRL